MNEFIVDGLINGGFTKEQIIEYTANYLAKGQISEDEAKQVLQSLFDIEHTDEGELIMPDELIELQERVITEASTPDKTDLLQAKIEASNNYTDFLEEVIVEMAQTVYE